MDSTRRNRRRNERDPLKKLQAKNKMLVAARVDDIRIEMGLSKSAFADLVGQKPSVITKWLSGTHNFTQDTYSLIEHKTNKKIFEGKAKVANEIVRLEWKVSLQQEKVHYFEKKDARLGLSVFSGRPSNSYRYETTN